MTVIVTEEGTGKMSVRLLFPHYVFQRNMLDPNLDESQGYDLEYNEMLVAEVDAMRKRDPKGRLVSNSPNPATMHRSGWQSNDGCESSPVFQKCMNRISKFFSDEVLPFHGIQNSNGLKMRPGNSWANINETMSWNRPHTHNGCWYSGVLYLKADGDEGNFSAIDTDSKVLSMFPHHQRVRTNWDVQPRTGDIHIFSSGLMHMVEPNMTDKERYSISFNMDLHDVVGPTGFFPDNGAGYFGQDFTVDEWNPDEFSFNLDERGNPIR